MNARALQGGLAGRRRSDGRRLPTMSSGIVLSWTGPLAALALLLTIDLSIGDLLPLRYLYLVPIWLAARLGGLGRGLTLAVVTSIACTFADAHWRASGRSLELTFIVRTAIFTGFAWIVDHMEERLRRSTHLASRDPMTGLLNRRAFGEAAYHSIRRCVMQKQPLTVILFDCDRFKSINDRFGHSAGDQVLRLIAKALESDARSTDLIGRLGGDEFIALLPNTSRVGARVFADRVQNEFRREARLLGFDWIGLSCGFAQIGLDGHSISQLLEYADREMYSRKASRNYAVTSG